VGSKWDSGLECVGPWVEIYMTLDSVSLGGLISRRQHALQS